MEVRVIPKLRNGFAELAEHPGMIAGGLMVAPHGDVDDRLQEAAVTAEAAGPSGLNHLVGFKKLPAMDERDPVMKRMFLFGAERFGWRKAHDREDSATSWRASSKLRKSPWRHLVW